MSEARFREAQEWAARFVGHGPHLTRCCCTGCDVMVPSCWESGMCRTCINEDCEHAEEDGRSSEQAARRILGLIGTHEWREDPVLYATLQNIRYGQPTEAALVASLLMLARERRERIRLDIERTRREPASMSIPAGSAPAPE